MNKYSEQLQALSDIRSMMEKSTKFVSLSGKTGISIGFIAITCAVICFSIADTFPFQNQFFHQTLFNKGDIIGLNPTLFIIILGGITAIMSIIVGYYYTQQKAKASNIKIWSKSFRLMMINIAIPLLTGGVFCIALAKYQVYELIAPATLIFYGLALINGSKYTLQDVNSLGLMEIGLGIISLFVPGYGLEFWTIGFGVFHIIYGIRINKKS